MTTLNAVNISEKGIVKNILSYNYTHQTAVKEYLNNVLDKNVDPDYKITFNLKDIQRSVFMFECVEEVCCGFKSLEEIQTAFKIADSERVGANNMGYGIFSPITINKEDEAHGLFIQNNDNGSFYSIVCFGPEQSQIWTIQGEFSGTTILGVDVSDMIVPGGTRFVWITSPAPVNLDGDDISLDADIMVRFVRKFWLKSVKIANKGDDVEKAILELGKYYSHYTSPGTSIFYGDLPITSIDFLKADEGQVKAERSYEISVMMIEGKKEYRIMDEEREWRNFTTKSTEPIGGNATRRHHARQQCATVTIHDINTPIVGEDSNMRDRLQKRKQDRKIWVKIGETYIFCEDFPLNGYPNIRAVIELENSGDNEFDYFISPDANKSNSKVINDIKDRISGLIKWTIKEHFTGYSGRVQISDTLKHEAWEFWNGNCCSGVCCSEDGCSTPLTPWKYSVKKIYVDEGSGVENLRTVCNVCIKKEE
jgi:hypothetical protein